MSEEKMKCPKCHSENIVEYIREKEKEIERLKEEIKKLKRMYNQKVIDEIDLC